MTDEPRPIDLSPLDPGRDGARLDALAASIAADAMAARARRSVVAELAAFRRPALAAAAIIAISTIPVLAASRPPVDDGTDALGVPTRLTALANRAEPPSLAELAAALRTDGDDHD